jgi:hypothetical protein
MFDVFKIDKADAENCPKTEYVQGKETVEKLIDWDTFSEAIDANTCGESTVVLGYWRKVAEEVDIQTFEKLYVLNTKTAQKMLIQDLSKKKGYSLLIFYTDKDLEGNPIENEADRIKGCIKIDGCITEIANDGTRKSAKLRNAISVELAIQISKSLRLFSLSFLPGVTPPKKRTKKNKENEEE